MTQFLYDKTKFFETKNWIDVTVFWSQQFNCIQLNLMKSSSTASNTKKKKKRSRTKQTDEKRHACITLVVCHLQFLFVRIYEISTPFFSSADPELLTHKNKNSSPKRAFVWCLVLPSPPSSPLKCTPNHFRKMGISRLFFFFTWKPFESIFLFVLPKYKMPFADRIPVAYITSTQ